MAMYDNADDMEREALMRQMRLQSSVQSPEDAARQGATAAPAEAPAQPATKYSLSGYDAAKLADPNKRTEKYKIGRVFQNHDPSKGITPELLADLNALDIGDFSGTGDKLSVKNSRNGSRLFDGTGDVIPGFKGTGPKSWTYLDTSPADAPAAGPGGSYGGMMPGGLTSSSAVEALMQDSTYNTFVKRLQGILGPASMDRDALMRLMGGN